MTHTKNSLQAALIAMVTPPPPFASKEMEQAYLSEYGERYAEYRKNAVMIALCSWMMFIFWDIYHALDDPQLRTYLWELVFYRMAGGLSTAFTWYSSLTDRFRKDERFATHIMFASNLTVCACAALPTLRTPYPYDIMYAIGLMMNMMYASSVLRLRAVPVIYLMLVNMAVAATILTVNWYWKSGQGHFQETYNFKLIALTSAVTMVGIFVGNMLELAERQRFAREQKLDQINKALTVKNLENENLNKVLSEANTKIQDNASQMIAMQERLLMDAERRTREKSLFLAEAVHDLRQPLQAISSALLPAMTGLKNSDLTLSLDMLKLTSSAAALMRSQLNDMLEFSRLEAGHRTSEIVTVDIVQLVNSVVFQLKDMAHKEGVAMTLHTGDTDHLLVASDVRFTERILLNILNNAIKYRCVRDKQACRVDVTLSVRGHIASIAVEDNGIGIAPDDLRESKIFQPFYQSPSNVGNVQRGVGLGLGIVKAMVEKMPEHAIAVESVLGKGSKFTLSLPVSQASFEQSFKVLNNEDGSTLADLDGMYICIVEDDDLVRNATLRLLSLCKAQCESFNSYLAFEQAVPSIERTPDLILSDFRLTQRHTAVDVLQLAEQTWGHIPFIVLAGQHLNPDTLRKLANHPVIYKPIGPQALVEACSKFWVAQGLNWHAAGADNPFDETVQFRP